MITAICVPLEDVNDSSVTITKILLSPGSEVSQGQPVIELETSKTIFEVAAPSTGYFFPQVSLQQEVAVGGLLAFINSLNQVPENVSLQDLTGSEQALGLLPGDTSQSSIAALAPSEAPQSQAKFTRKAEEFAAAHSIRPEQVQERGIITLEQLQRWYTKLQPQNAGPTHQLVPSGIKRVLVLGAGMAAMQILDILWHDGGMQPVGCLDDNPQMLGKELFGAKVLGPMSMLSQLWQERRFDAAIVGVGTNMKVRHQLYTQLKEQQIPLANAIDPSARLNRHALIGQGVVICSFVHLGVDAYVGDNCFLAAHSNVDHHCRLGDSVLLGPGCLLSGHVTIGEQTLVGSGVIIQPNLAVGAKCRLASGAVIIRDIPALSAVKVRVIEEVCSREP